MDQRVILFYVFLFFFILIGIISLLSLAGLIKTDPSFRRWAQAGFVVGIAGVIFGLAKQTFNQQAPIFVTLTPPKEATVLDLDPMSGRYAYDVEDGPEKVSTKKGRVKLQPGQGIAWMAELPQEVLDKSVKLYFKDGQGVGWTTEKAFWPNHIQQALVKGQPLQAELQAPQPARDAATKYPAPAYAASLAATAVQAAPVPKFTNYARPVRQYDGRTYYHWRVFMNEPPAVLNTIARVEYVLHPTFPEPFQVRSDPNQRFALETTGWGEFTIIITIVYKDGKANKTSYHLDLQKSWPKE